MCMFQVVQLPESGWLPYDGKQSAVSLSLAPCSTTPPIELEYCAAGDDFHFCSSGAAPSVQPILFQLDYISSSSPSSLHEPECILPGAFGSPPCTPVCFVPFSSSAICKVATSDMVLQIFNVFGDHLCAVPRSHSLHEMFHFHPSSRQCDCLPAPVYPLSLPPYCLPLAIHLLWSSVYHLLLSVWTD